MKKFSWLQIFLSLVLIALVAGAVVCAVFAITANSILVFLLIILLIVAIATALELFDSVRKKGRDNA